MKDPRKQGLYTQVRPISSEDRQWITQILIDHWGSHLIISRGKSHDASNLPGFMVLYKGNSVGLITFQIDRLDCEVVTLNSWHENIGVGTILLDSIKQEAIRGGCSRIWLITANDNLHALCFYQKRGFQITAVYPNELATSRKLKPAIPEIGLHNIPLRDEIELQFLLD